MFCITAKNEPMHQPAFVIARNRFEKINLKNVFFQFKLKDATIQNIKFCEIVDVSVCRHENIFEKVCFTNRLFQNSLIIDKVIIY